MPSIDFDDGDLIDGTIDDWPVSALVSRFPGQGWDVHLAPYSQEVDGEEQSAPDHIVLACYRVSDLHYRTKDDARRALAAVNFTPEN